MSESTQNEPFNLIIDKYERLVRTADRATCFDATIAVIDDVTSFCKVKGLAEQGVLSHVREHWYTRLAAALTSVIVKEDMGLTLSQLEKITRRKQAIVYIFNASGYRGTGHLLAMISRPRAEGGLKVPLERAAMVLAFCGIDDVPPELIQLMPQQSPEVLLILLLGWLNERAVLTKRGEENRTALLAMAPLIETATIGDKDVPLLVNAWMYCSYASSPGKHLLKKSINKLLLGLLASLPRPVPKDRAETREKPLLLVVHERFNTDHAMYRCYAPSIQDLSKYFDLVAMVEEGYIDHAGSSLFRAVIKIPKGKKNIAEITREICSLSPDAVYYPSLGMSHWTVLLAQLRLAPIQVMTLGHPATSMSDAIDYVYTGSMDGDLGAIFSEKVIVGPKNADFVAHSELPIDLPPLLSASDREVRVAVNSKVMKLSYRLIEICKRLTNSAERPVRFTFFPGERNLFFDGLEPAIKSQLPNADVAPYVSYDQFLHQISSCDLALAAFPFGNTNSTVDTCLLGIPTVVHFGPESPAQSDALVLHTVGLPDWLVCDTDELYYETALRLIDNPSARLAALGDVGREKVRGRLFGGAATKPVNPFADTLNYIFHNHSALVASEQRVFHYSELLTSE